VIVRVRPEDPDPAAVRAALRMLAEQDVVKVTRNMRNEDVFVLSGPSLRADATVLHGTLDLLPGWPLAPAEPPTAESPAAPPSPESPAVPLDTPERDQGHRVRLVRVPVQGRVTTHDTATGVTRENARISLVVARIRPTDPDPEAVRATLRALAARGVVRATRNLADREVYVLAGPPANAAEVHRVLDALPGWPPSSASGGVSGGSDLGPLPSLPDGL
jgi:hypothetical protein